MSHVFDLLSAHLDGELAPGETVAVQGHLPGCEVCRSELDGLRQVRDAVRSLPQLDAPIPLLAAARRRPKWISAAASVAAGALAIGLVVAPGQSAQAFDLDTMAGQHTTRTGVDPGISSVRGSVGAP